MLSLNKPEWYLILIGCLACLITGGVQPAFSIIFTKAINAFQKCDRAEQEYAIVFYSLLFVFTGFLCFIGNFLQSFMFGWSGENLTKRIRSKCFRAMLSQEIGWYDMSENNVGKLTTRLATEAAAIQGATGVRIGVRFLYYAFFFLTIKMNLSIFFFVVLN